jgi:Arc/MetJ family transcription regulator
MRTTLNLNEELINQIVRITGMKNKSQAVNKVLKLYVSEMKKQDILKMRGTLHLENNWNQLREMELDEK